MVIALYLGVLVVLGCYGLHRTLLAHRLRWERPPAPELDAALELPFVTVQLPLFNERTVAVRLLRAAGALRYPKDRFEVQILDDSTDDTRELVDRAAAELRSAGVDTTVLRRARRTGYKAGALDAGLRRAKGSLVCVFDADFTPQPSFLEKLVPHFADEKVGMVQARWGHLNRDESTLTRAQSTLLDGHFVVEHTVRSDRGLFFNFNGTAGIWRRRTIEEAGGWQHDTLTEDLDLSYRAQLAGWRFVYAPEVVAPAEVPPDIAAFKSQQHRWAKGSVQVARKLGWRILRADVSWRVKLEAFFHLTGNAGYPAVLLLAVLLPLTLLEQERFPVWTHLLLFLVCSLSVIRFYDQSQKVLGRRPAQRLRDVVTALCLGIGMCVAQSRAVLEGFFPRTGAFVRTPKRGDRTQAGGGYRAVWRGLPGIELLFAGWFAWALAAAWREGLWGSLPFLALFFAGFLWVGAQSLRHWVGSQRQGFA